MFSVEKKSKQPTKGETCSKWESIGISQDYLVNIDDYKVSVLIRYTAWQNGERDVNCLDFAGDKRLNKLPGRLRFCIEPHGLSHDMVTLKTAIIKSEPPAHANLYKRDIAFYHEIMGVDLVSELISYGDCKIDTKEVLLNTTGRNRTELCMVFPTGNEILPIAAFVLTRIYPILLSDRPRFWLHILDTENGKNKLCRHAA